MVSADCSFVWPGKLVIYVDHHSSCQDLHSQVDMLFILFIPLLWVLWYVAKTACHQKLNAVILVRAVVFPKIRRLWTILEVSIWAVVFCQSHLFFLDFFDISEYQVCHSEWAIFHVVFEFLTGLWFALEYFLISVFIVLVLFSFLI